MSEYQFQLPSFAKINWSLRILGSRPDGYHEVETVLQTISLRDDLGFAPSHSTEIQLVCDDLDIPVGDSNLIIRAAHKLRKRLGITEGALIHLRKNIPTRAGLGGASSNAAISLLGLLKLWERELSPEELDVIGSELGADVPFFFRGGCAVATGTGTRISSLPDRERQALLVVTPNVGVSTAEAYAAWDSAALTTNVADSILSISRARRSFADRDLSRLPREYLHNDFERVIFDIEPEIERASKVLAGAGAEGVLLAGSGSSVFGIFENEDSRQRALNETQWDASWQVFPCATVSREEYLLALSSCGTPLLRSFNRGSDTGA